MLQSPSADLWRRIVLLAAAAFAAAPPVWAQKSEAAPMHVSLPSSLDGWTLSNPPKRVEPKAIFDYMDGAGELYLAYRFRYLEVYEYTRPGATGILVELYWMQSSDDAYGLLSGDWGGEPVDLVSLPDPSAPAPPHALYGSGLLRIWSGDLYARVMTLDETGDSRRTVLALGKSIVAGRIQPPPPHLISTLPAAVARGFTLRTDRTVYLRSHLVLNSVYFLSSENLLDLNLNCEVAAAAYRNTPAQPSSRVVRALLVRYPDEATARIALAHFQTVYLPEKSTSPGDRAAVAIEDGWTAYMRSGRTLALVFEAPDEPSTQMFLDSMNQAINHLEDSHE